MPVEKIMINTGLPTYIVKLPAEVAVGSNAALLFLCTELAEIRRSFSPSANLLVLPWEWETGGAGGQGMFIRSLAINVS